MDNSDDLFGGLPAVSKAENSVPIDTTLSAATNIAAKKHVASLTPFVGGGKRTLPEKRHVGGASLVRSLGTAGTAMAFVPHAIRKKKKSSQPPPRQQQQEQTSAKQSTVVRKEIMPDNSTAQTNSSDTRSHAAVTAPQQQHITMAKSGVIHADKIDKDQGTCDAHPDNDNNNEPYLEDEPESLRLLHAGVTDPYDPHRPNDYLAYRERKKTEQARRDLQRSALRRLDAQEQMRRRIEEERKEMLASGELDKFVDSHIGGEAPAASTGGGMAAAASGRGRGRGRGVANLPAWLVKKQQEQQEVEKQNEMRSADGQFDDSKQT